MDARGASQAGPVTRPLAGPITTTATVRDGRNTGHIRATGETTVWGIPPDILTPRWARERSPQ